ncbi:BON domain-containing protein [Acidipila rosea]|uniref:Osmotically-inducible protein OsmY n=1 Tax=Acidipila rosea TaxID=768535 RepID=A0A4R1LCK9_9BACT|nr:BON domain-containing protein [Acidipila rosea]TCK74279.1 osmotically-inducible protein OsmY [Acidipila rosea]
MTRLNRLLVSALAGFMMAGTPSILLGRHFTASAQQATDASSKMEAGIKKALGNSRFKNVQSSVSDGIATLTGSVKVFDDKDQAEKKVKRVKGVVAVRNEIEVPRGEMNDQQLQQKLVRAIEYDRVGYGTTAFNAISVSVQNGVVTLGGTAWGPVDADSAAAVAANTPGVQDVVNNIAVDPVSPMDDRIRIATFRSIYGFGMLNKYAIDPGKPIRISVQNGNVTLYGVVDSQADKDAAGIRANQVPGVFHVTNNLQVAGSSNKPK